MGKEPVLAGSERAGEMYTIRPPELPAHRLAGVRKRFKTLGAHRLAPVHKLDLHYSSRRGPGCGRTAERRVSARRGWAGETKGHFEHPAKLFLVMRDIPAGNFLTTLNRFSTAC